MRHPRGLAPAALLTLLSCAPHYESGKTACATTGQLCPDGYLCRNTRCYKLGEEPDASAAGGTGGGSPDARVTGTGGTGGGGAGGSGGSGGTGGAGGTGGSKDAGRPADAPPMACNDPMFPVACPMSEAPDLCWSTGVDCSTIKRCGLGDTVYACGMGSAVDCRYRANACQPRAEVGGTRTCTDPMFPVLCPPLGDLGPVCVSSNEVDCSGRVVCGREISATLCRKGQTIDCTKPRANNQRCIAGPVGDGGAGDGAAPVGGATDAAKDGPPG